MKSFLEFIGKQGNIWKIATVFALGIVLISLGTFGTNKKNEKIPTDKDDIEELCSSISGVGKCRVYINYSSENNRYSSSYKKSSVVGIAVVCEGGNSPEVKKNLVDMLSAVFGIGTNRVSVSHMRE